MSKDTLPTSLHLLSLWLNCSLLLSREPVYGIMSHGSKREAGSPSITIGISTSPMAILQSGKQVPACSFLNRLVFLKMCASRIFPGHPTLMLVKCPCDPPALGTPLRSTPFSLCSLWQRGLCQDWDMQSVCLWQNHPTMSCTFPRVTTLLSRSLLMALQTWITAAPRVDIRTPN